MPAISVIVTFYNLEGYVRRCVDSILSQREFEDFEAILVDDGSVDGTGAALDVYASVPRVRVEHIANGGTSRARNHGVEVARAQLVTFVDGDDYLSPWYLKSLYDAWKETGVSLVVGRPRIALDGEEVKDWAPATSVKMLDPIESARSLLYEEVTEGPWAKLGTRELYLKYPFPDGRRYEDVAQAGNLYVAAGTIAVLEEPIYAYVMRGGSVMHKRHASKQQVDDFLWAIDQFLDPIAEAFPELTDERAYREALELMRVWSAATTLADASVRDAYRKEILERLRVLNVGVTADPNAPSGNKKRLKLLVRAPRLYDVMFTAYELLRKHVRRS